MKSTGIISGIIDGDMTGYKPHMTYDDEDDEDDR